MKPAAATFQLCPSSNCIGIVFYTSSIVLLIARHFLFADTVMFDTAGKLSAVGVSPQAHREDNHGLLQLIHVTEVFRGYNIIIVLQIGSLRVLAGKSSHSKIMYSDIQIWK